MGPPYALTRGGWKRDTLKIGDTVTVNGAALAKDGSNTAGSHADDLDDAGERPEAGDEVARCRADCDRAAVVACSVSVVAPRMAPAPAAAPPDAALARRPREPRLDAGPARATGKSGRARRHAARRRYPDAAVGARAGSVPHLADRSASAARTLQAGRRAGFFNAPGLRDRGRAREQRIFILNIAGPHSWRVIYMDGRPHPTGDDLRPDLPSATRSGDGKATRWSIDTVGFNEKQWLAGSTRPPSSCISTERISRPNLKTLLVRSDDRRPRRLHRAVVVRWTITEKSARRGSPAARSSNTSARTISPRRSDGLQAAVLQHGGGLEPHEGATAIPPRTHQGPAVHGILPPG